MKIPILIEPVDGHGFRARAGEPFPFSADGQTRALAVQRLESLVLDRIASGVELSAIEIPAVVEPTMRSWENPAYRLDPGDPLVREWLHAMEEHRKQLDEDAIRE